MRPHPSQRSQAVGAAAGPAFPPKDNDMAFDLSSPRPLFVQRERKGFHRIFAAAFVMCFLGAVVDLFLPRQWRLLPQRAGRRRSFLDHVIDEAKALTAFAFMD